jgi:hypothetical protein
MDRAQCPECGYLVGLGTVSEPGVCPNCETPLMLTAEFRALSREEVLREARRRGSEQVVAEP